MSAKSKLDFPFDIRLIEWKHSLQCFAYGIRRFFMKEDCYEPDLNYRQILTKIMVGNFHDLRYMSDKNPNFVVKSNSVYFQAILNKEKF